jgi:xylulokinase
MSGAPERSGSAIVAGVDCSTQATKVLLVELDSGRIVGEGRVSNTVSGVAGTRESDPEQWWSGLREAIASTGRAREIEAIAIAAQQHGLVVLQAPGGRALRPAILWNDTRAAANVERLLEELGGPGEWAQAVGVVPVPALTVASWAWLRDAEPELARGAGAIRLPHDFLTERLTGEPVSDRGDASGTGWWSAAHERYVIEVLSLPSIELDQALLPHVLGPEQPAGRLRDGAAAELGLRAGIPVGAGTGDNMGAALALDPAPGQPVISLGSSGTVYCVSSEPACDPSGIIAGFADATGRHLPLACTLNATLAVDRFARWLGLDREAVQEGGKVVVLPFLDGERTPNLPAAAATITGLRHDTTPGQILMAAHEGVIASLLIGLEALESQPIRGELRRAHGSCTQGECQEDSGEGPPIVLIGGGARGRVYREVLRRMSGRAIELPHVEELVAYGAAAQAAAVLSGEKPQTIAGSWNARAGTVLEPAPRDEGALERFRRVLTETRSLNKGW